MTRLRIVAVAVATAGLVLAGVALLYGVPQSQDGLEAAQAMYEAQGVTLTYNEQGQLVDRGTPEGAQKILALLEGDWKYPVNRANLDPEDPLVNTRDELMYQYATITYHVLHGEVDVTLTEQQVPITYRGVTYTEPGVYRIAPLAFYAELDRTHPIEGQLRAAWSPLALGLLGTLAGAHANQAAGEVASMVSFGMAAVGVLFVASGAGLFWATLGRQAPTPQAPPARLSRAPVATVGVPIASRRPTYGRPRPNPTPDPIH